LDVVALRPIDDAALLDPITHGLSRYRAIGFNVSSVGRDCAELLFQRVVKGNGAGATANILGYVIVPGSNDLLARLLHDVEKFKLRQPLRLVVGDGLLDQGGNLLEIALEGLSVSYFLRASKMYDTLMQMGRWFGYRPGYVDLCRLYTTPDLELWFRHVSSSAEELRNRLDHMAMIGSSPETYGLRIQSHDILLVTAQNKMRHAKLFQVSFQGESKIQTVFFNDPALNIRNAASITVFLEGLGPSNDFGANYKAAEKRRIWTSVDGKQVANLLGNLLFPEEARDVNASRLSSYIREQLSAGELTEWTVAIPSGDGETVACNGWTFATIERAALKRTRATGRYVVKTILSPRDEAIDLAKDEYQDALEATNNRRASNSKKPTKVPDGPEIRRVRGRNPKRALLLLYPLSPKAAEVDCPVPIFGIVVSFPDSSSGRAASYRFNTVEQRLEPA
jgi:hypothetical protein